MRKVIKHFIFHLGGSIRKINILNDRFVNFRTGNHGERNEGSIWKVATAPYIIGSSIAMSRDPLGITDIWVRKIKIIGIRANKMRTNSQERNYIGPNIF